MVYRTKEILEEIKNDMAINFPLKPNYPRLDSKTANRILKEKGYYPIMKAYKEHLKSKGKDNVQSS